MRRSSEALLAIAPLRPATLEEYLTLAEKLSESGLVPKDYQGKPANVLVAIQSGAEVGLHPMQALQSIAVFNGRPTMWGDAVLGLVIASGQLEDIQETDDEQTQTATCTVKRKGIPTPVVRTFSQDDAEKTVVSVWDQAKNGYAKVSLASKGVWAAGPKYRARMRQMRARSWALRDLFSDILKGIIPREEGQDYDDRELNPKPPDEATLTKTLMPRKVGETPPPALEAPVIPATPATEQASWPEIIEAMFPPAAGGPSLSPEATPGREEPNPERVDPASPGGPPIVFMIGKQEFKTRGITRQQMLWTFELEERVEKKQKGLTKAILKQCGVEHRADLTVTEAEKFLIRLSETLGLDPPWVKAEGHAKR